jgi:hypothetical protein
MRVQEGSAVMRRSLVMAVLQTGNQVDLVALADKQVPVAHQAVALMKNSLFAEMMVLPARQVLTAFRVLMVIPDNMGMQETAAVQEVPAVTVSSERIIRVMILSRLLS